MVLEEKHRGDHDVALRDVGETGFQRPGFGRELVGSVNGQHEAGMSLRSDASARTAAADRWLSMVTRTTRIGAVMASSWKGCTAVRLETAAGCCQPELT